MRHLQELAINRLGLEARLNKESLFRVRTARHMRELGVSDPAAYLRLLEADQTGQKMQGLLDLMTTNHTAFWREPAHFEWLREQLAPAGKTGAGQQTMWCAACSSGEEAYTLAMVARDAMGPAAPERMRILATDVSMRMLKIAQTGVYARERIEPLPAAWREAYFEGVPNSSRGNFRVKPEIRRMVHFRWLNLAEPIPPIGPFPFIFCRNVMIYFSLETRVQIAHRLLHRLTPGGYLLVGHAEGLRGLEETAEYIRPAIYRRKTAGAKEGGAPWDWS